MRRLASVALLIILHVVHAQTINWQAIVSDHGNRLQQTTLTDSQTHNLQRMLVRHSRTTGQTWCDKDDTSWVDNLKASDIPIGVAHAMLIEAGQGCARGAQGANGAMWLIRWQGPTPVLLGELAGWPYRVLPHTSHGLHDVTVGWHMSAREFGLSLFRFDGTHYQQAGTADVVCDDYGKCKATPSARK